jgi:hypothetical protein
MYAKSHRYPVRPTCSRWVRAFPRGATSFHSLLPRKGRELLVSQKMEAIIKKQCKRTKDV